MKTSDTLVLKNKNDARGQAKTYASGGQLGFIPANPLSGAAWPATGP